MWALRAAVRPGARLSRVTPGCRAPRAAPLLPPCPERALAASRGGLAGSEGRGGGGRGPRADGRRGRAGEQEGEEEPEEAEEAEELLRRDPLLPAGAQRVCLVHPDIKWGPGKPQGTRAEWQVAEARALVHTLDGWSVVDTVVAPTKAPDRKLVFGRGTLERLTEKIRGSPETTAVFLNLERVAAPTKKELEAAWGVPVFDRFTVVLHIFRCNARTKEARLQVALAELPLLRSHLKNDVAHLGGRGGGSRYIMGSGESFLEVQQRLLKDKEVKIRKALDRLRQKRLLLGRQRKQREFPVVSLVGYTNCGKTTLVKALTGDAALQPRDQLFATLDVTAHAGGLPSRLTVIYMDTIGFLSQLPHSLVESFSATLQDVAHSDLLVHVRDVSHAETELQKASVLSALRGLHLPPPLLERMLEVHNKADLLPGYRPAEPGAVAVSALRGLGLEELKARLQDAVLRATGRRVLTLRVPLAGPQLRCVGPARREGWSRQSPQPHHLPRAGAQPVVHTLAHRGAGSLGGAVGAPSGSPFPTKRVFLPAGCIRRPRCRRWT
ncbi:putative GTP-binding protein 6 isoform X3 [Hippopotamus amphibius kiboko]|uniref:putative GTP-binding protein 6 isoform X3 n=1 Tax=Hippopotamus amphibius kiboko TaxID=575201 RepID=UPI002598C807|nr:putative GTP-binding protein 6 isoform X3 [Hippopotamus amphibius kiboko]